MEPSPIKHAKQTAAGYSTFRKSEKIPPPLAVVFFSGNRAGYLYGLAKIVVRSEMNVVISFSMSRPPLLRTRAAKVWPRAQASA